MNIVIFIKYFFILFLLTPVASQTLESATSDLISEVRKDHALPVNVFSFSKNYDMNLLLHNLWHQKNISVKFSHYDKMLYRQRKVRFSVKIFDSVERYLKLMDSYSPFSHYVHGSYVLIFPGEVKVNKTLVFEKMWLKSFYKVVILTQVGDVVDLSTFYPFQKEYCNKTPAISINEYVNNSWTGKTFFPKTIKNFFKCPINIAAAVSPTRFIEIVQANGTTEYIGTDAEIMNALAGAFNFHPQINYSSKPNDFGDVYGNGTSFGIVEQVVNGNSEMIIGLFVDLKRTRFMDISQPYYLFPVSVMVPAGAPYTSLENLIRPFSLTVWISFAILMTGAILVIRFRIPAVQKLIGETENLNYYLILIESIIGDSMKHLPKKNIPRILVMAFFIYCLVMRTIYESKLFHFFHSGENKRTVRNLDDMINRDLNLYITLNLNDMFSEIIKYPKERKIIIYDGDEIEALKNATLNPSFNGGVVTGITNDLYYNDPTKGVPFKFLEKPLAVLPVVVYYRKNSYLVEEFNEKLGAFKSTGLINYWTNLHINRKYSKPSDSSGPTQITIETIYGAFQLLFFGWVIAIIAFILELVHYKCRKCRVKVRASR